MNECAEETGQILGIMFNQRTDPKYQKVRELVQNGELGDILRINWLITNWFRTETYYRSGGWRATWGGEGGGVLMNQCPHNIDLWQWMFGMPSRIRASCYFGKYHDIEVEDDVTAYMEYENGATGAFITTTGESPGTNRLEVTGERGKVVVEAGKVIFHRTVQEVGEFRSTSEGRFSTPECWKCEIPIYGGNGEQHIGIHKDFHKAILTGSDLLADGREGIHCVELINGMLYSGWNEGQWVDLPIDADMYYDALQEQIANSTFEKQVDDGADLDLGGSFNR
jgi:predicted dehydrogenase